MHNSPSHQPDGRDAVFDNSKIDKFREMLDARGVSSRCLWSAARDGKRHDVALMQFIGRDLDVKITTAILVSYGKDDGYALYVPAAGRTFDADVAAIVGDAA